MKNLNKKDYKVLSRLIRITNSIIQVYDRLYELEVYEEKDSLAYKNINNYLERLISYEKEIYLNAEINNSKVIRFVKNLLDSSKSLSSNIDSIINQSDCNQALRRILFHLNEMYEPNSCDYISNDSVKLMQQVSDILSYGFVSDNHDVDKELKKYFNKDILGLLLLFLEDYICDPKYKSVRNELIKTKYYIISINCDIEKDLLIENFKIDATIYLNSKWIADLLNIHPNVYELYKYMYGYQIYKTQANELMKMTDIEYRELPQVINSICRLCFIKSGLILIDNRTTTDLKEYLESCSDSISKWSLIKALDETSNDIEKVKIISIGGKK